MAEIGAEADGDCPGVLEIAEFGTARKDRCRDRHHCHSSNDNEQDANPQTGAPVAQEAGRDALVDDIALLEEQLPSRRCWRRSRRRLKVIRHVWPKYAYRLCERVF
jgi:hypothetical protein